MNSNDEDRVIGDIGRSPGEVAERVIRAASRRAAILGWATMALWVLVATGCVLGVHGYFRWIYPKWVVIATDGEIGRHSAATSEFHQITAGAITAYAYVWAGLVVLAATSTLLYIRSSQTARLAQIQVSLEDISAELGRLARSEN